ncbi:MAG TPA: sulfur oxidation c-type cytochrome SoxX [Burkholderiales bacterium]|nr:sulfur oxidation c-type cytochrome SoxX [Burkholderiales bacterium]
MTNKTICLSLGGLAAALLAARLACADPTPLEVRALLHRDFHAKGQAVMSRVDQDDLQYLCTVTDGKPSAKKVKEMEADQLALIRYPADGNYMGDWKRGAEIAASGKGMTWKEKPGQDRGGGCYNCHQLSPKQESYGTVGPSLKHYASVRPGIDGQKYVYAKIYDSKAFNLCSQMPRFGTSSSLTEQDIKDLTAYLLDPASPVNQ